MSYFTEAIIERRTSCIHKACPSVSLGDCKRLAVLSKKKKRVTLGELSSSLGAPETASSRVLRAYIDTGFLVPTKSSKRTQDGTWTTYNLAVPDLSEAEEASLKAEIKALDPRIWQGNSSWLLQNPVAYEVFRDAVIPFDRWLRERDRERPAIGPRDRAYEIWGDEKVFDSKGATVKGVPDFLKAIGWDIKRLNCYETKSLAFPMTLARERPAGSTVVFSENDCLYEAIRALLRARPLVHLFGLDIAGAIHTGGKALFASAEEGKGSLIREFIAGNGIDLAETLYVGDIDPEGIKMQQDAEDIIGVRPLIAAYERMCALHADRRDAGLPMRPYSERQTDSYGESRFLSLLTPQASCEAARSLSERIRIPQEILTPWFIKEGRRNG